VQGEELVVVRGTAADREELEIHCHGGSAASEAVLRSLESCGAVRQAWSDWLTEQENLISREARVALPHAGGPKAARILCRQLAGDLEREVDRVGGLLAAGDRAAFEAGVDRLLRAARVGLRLIRPWRVVVTGAVNAGKSSLVNALAGYARSIVSPEPGTTRDLLETRLVLGGWEIDLVDAAGWRGEGHLAGAVEREGIERAVNAAAAADLVLSVDPVGSQPTSRLGKVGPLESGIESLEVVTKSDLAEGAWNAVESRIFTSARTGQGIEALAEAIIQRLIPEELTDPDLLAGPVPFTPRQVAMIAALAGLGKSDPLIGSQDS
jgi:tRNA modification GTPase